MYLGYTKPIKLQGVVKTLIMGAVASAVAWALAIANDDSHGYDQTSRWGLDYDCSSLVIQAYEQAGVPVKTNGATYTGNMVSVFKRTGFVDVTSQVNVKTGAGLITGDVVWKSGHVEMMSRSGYLVGASINENGETTGGQTGDQTGQEIRERTYYNAPWTTVLRYTEQSVSKSDVVSGNRYLSQSEMTINATYIKNWLQAKGWTLNAICGMLGNMQVESTINPALWQSMDEGNTNLGYGLVQWTPATKLISYAESIGSSYSDIDVQLKRIIYEKDNNIQYYKTSDYPLTFTEFTKSVKSPEYLASAFLKNYERAGVEKEDVRRSNARYWYDYFTEQGDGGIESDDPVGNGKVVKSKAMSLLMLVLATRK